jgi:starch phosphorylase
MKRIAYFSMEIAVNEDIPTYAGGLGILAGDTLKSFADLNFPIVAVTLMAKSFTQKVDENGNQTEIYKEWNLIELGFELLNEKINIEIGDEKVFIKVWKYVLVGTKSSVVIYFLDSNCEENSLENRKLTSKLYFGDKEHRLKQEIILGIGGVRLLKKLNYKIEKYHLNEGHSALVILELLKKYTKQEVREKIVFTTHTPVPAGHDKFSKELVEKLLGRYFKKINYKITDFLFNNELNMTYLAFNNSNHINGVTIRHKKVSRELFCCYPIESITNGVYHLFWTGKHIQDVYNRYLGDSWIKAPSSLRYVFSIPSNEIFNAHQKAKKDLFDFIKKETNDDLDENIFTIGWARRFTLYKRSYLIFMNSKKLKEIAEKVGPIQIIFSGKAAPDDLKGKENLRYVFEVKKALQGSKIKIVFLENYNISIAKKMVSGVDLWLNTPQIPLEASGTSGMKAAFNGIPSLSSLDGWWLEGHIENITGWSIGKREGITISDYDESDELYRKLEQDILPIYYNNKEKWQRIMASTIMINGSMFNSYRMVNEYILNSYL